MKKLLDNAFTVAVVIIAVFVAFRFISPRLFPANTPEVFAAGYTLTDALEQSATTGKPVFAVASASWCGPCQAYKKGALVNADVESWLTENTIPVYIDVDKNSSDATALSVSTVPATFLLDASGEVTARAQGQLSSRKLLDWLNNNSSGS